MNRKAIDTHISDIYGVSAEFPWIKYPTHAVYRHVENKKWFAVIMTVPASSLGLDTDEELDIINLKCGAILTSSLLTEDGIYPAYHMHKTNWVSAVLGNIVSDDTIKWLIDISYDLTKEKHR